MPYTFIEGLTVADVAFSATGRTLDELFASAGLAVTNVMVKDIASIRPVTEKEIILQDDTPELLLFNFLQELIFLKDVDLLLFSTFTIKIVEDSGTYHLNATVSGEPLDMKRHELLVDVKAVTMHRFEVKRTGRGWEATVVLDI